MGCLRIPGSIVASGTAIFPVRITVTVKLLAADSTGEMVYRFSLDLILMRIPPFHPAGITAELFRFPMCLLLYRLPALQTAGIGSNAARIPVYRGLYCADWQVQLFGNLR